MRLNLKYLLALAEYAIELNSNYLKVPRTTQLITETSQKWLEFSKHIWFRVLMRQGCSRWFLIFDKLNAWIGIQKTDVLHFFRFSKNVLTTDNVAVEYRKYPRSHAEETTMKIESFSNYKSARPVQAQQYCLLFLFKSSFSTLKFALLETVSRQVKKSKITKKNIKNVTYC